MTQPKNNTNSSHPMSQEVIKIIIHGLDEAKNSMEKMREQIQSFELESAVLGEKFKSISNNVENLMKIIKEGNGKESLLDRVSILENKYESIDKYLDNNKEANLENIKGKWQIRIALMTGSLGLLGGLITAIFSFFGS